MLNNKLITKKFKNAFIITLAIFMVLIIAGFIIVQYDALGERKLPFKLSRMNIVSTATGEQSQKDDGNWYMNVLQKNDIYFYIEKNKDYKDNAVIKKISFDNFVIEEKNKLGEVNVYKPNEESSLYKYKEEFIVNNLEYTGAKETNNGLLQINNQGGLIGFSIANSNLGEWLIEKEKTVTTDGTLLNLVNVKYDDVKFSISFDMIISVEQGKDYKANIKLELPLGDITKEGVCSREDTVLRNVIFKRI